ncbi:MAG: DNA primase, partial [bacterium]
MSQESQWERAKEEIRQRVDIVSVVQDYVSLEKKGKSYWALCPFHVEDTPSFCVTPEMGIFKCFGCDVGGDVFAFVQKKENCDFMEALSMLSERVGVELPESNRETSDDGETSFREKMYRVNEYAVERYRDAFWGDPGQDARNYMKDRGFTEETLEEFEIGFAPDGWDNLLRALKRDECDPAIALKAGLLGKSNNDRVYDKFRSRIIFPIRNAGGRVVGFGGRIFEGDGDAPKYLNSPDSPVFEKRNTLYGLTRAREAIREKQRCLVMEVYTDVIQCYQSGYREAVASLGTAITEQQVQQLKRYGDEIEVVIVTDGDEAGRRAARRGGEIALNRGMDCSIVLLPDEQDPDDLLKEDPGQFEQFLDSRLTYFDALYEWLTEKHSPETTDGKEAILKEMVPLLARVPSELKREERARELAETLSVQDDYIFRLLRRSRNRSDSEDDEHVKKRLRKESGEYIEELFIRSLASHPEQITEAIEKISRKDFSDERCARYVQSLRSIVDEGDDFSAERWIQEVPEEFSSHLAGLLSWDESEQMRIAQQENPVRIARSL